MISAGKDLFVERCHKRFEVIGDNGKIVFPNGAAWRATRLVYIALKMGDAHDLNCLTAIISVKLVDQDIGFHWVLVGKRRNEAAYLSLLCGYRDRFH
jgi:hypothetical protein